MSPPPAPDSDGVTQARIVRLWWPLASSWLLMAAELPILAAVVARLPAPEVQLAAHGALVIPIAFAVEAPIIMLLSASTALCGDRAAYLVVRRFMLLAGGLLTALHAAIAFTGLHDVIARDILGVPEAVIEPARLGLQLLLPWTGAIAFRRFHQGLLIRRGRSRSIAAGTLVRLTANCSVLALGLWHGSAPGIAIGAAGLSAGVVAEAAFVAWRARAVVADLLQVEPTEPQLTHRGFLAFYLPLALTPVLSLAVPPLGAAAMSRMPDPLTSLAAWPAVFGFVFLLRSASFASAEVIVSLLGEPGAPAELRRFSTRLALATSLLVALVAGTPLARGWFVHVSGLPPELASVCRIALALAVLHPALTAFEHYHQARLVHARRTRSVTLGMAWFLATAVAGYTVAVAWAPLKGVHVVMIVLTLASAARVAWLAARNRQPRRVASAPAKLA